MLPCPLQEPIVSFPGCHVVHFGGIPRDAIKNGSVQDRKISVAEGNTTDLRRGEQMNPQGERRWGSSAYSCVKELPQARKGAVVHMIPNCIVHLLKRSLSAPPLRVRFHCVTFKTITTTNFTLDASRD